MFLTCKFLRGKFDGVSSFEIINMVMIILSLIDLGLKYGYDSIVWDNLLQATTFITRSANLTTQNSFIDFAPNYLFYESISLLDSIIIFLMSLSIIKYTFFWIPSLGILTESFSTYFNSTIKKILYFIILISMAFSVYCHFFYSYVCFGFFDLSFSMIRTNLLFIQGALFNKNKLYLAEETMEYVYARIGWAAALFNMGLIHFFGRYVILTIIVAFMKKDIEVAR